MEGISKDELIRLQSSILARDDEECANLKLLMLTVIIDQCQELQEPWMTLEEFLKSGFEGLCWIALTNKFVFECRYQEWDFIVKNGCVNYESITHVMPIHKPEPPK